MRTLFHLNNTYPWLEQSGHTFDLTQSEGESAMFMLVGNAQG